MYKTFIIILLTTIPIVTYSQQRYLESAFDSVEINTYTYVTKAGENLNLDLYLPAFDAEKNRPLIIYVHGGGFSGGTRNEDGIVTFCKRLAGYGYATASISYRLTRKGTPEGFGCDCKATDKLNTFRAAVEDLQDATFFLIERREIFGIDPHRVILAGSSAGAETVLNAAYMPPMCYGLNSGPVSYAGVISMAGAISDTVKLFHESAVPSLLFHGTCDDLVPYGTAPHRHCLPTQPGYLPLNGSYPISQKLEQLNVPYWLHTTCGGGHEIAGTPMSGYFNEIISFCNDYVIEKTGTIKKTVVAGNQSKCVYEQYDFCNP